MEPFIVKVVESASGQNVYYEMLIGSFLYIKGDYILICGGIGYKLEQGEGERIKKLIGR